MIKYILFFLLIASQAQAATEISTAGTNIGIGTTSTKNALSVKSQLVVGSATYTNTTAPSNGALIEGNVGIGTIRPSTLFAIGSSSSAASTTKNAFNIDSNGNITNLGGVVANINASTVDLTSQGGSVKFGNNSSSGVSSVSIHALSDSGYISIAPSSDIEKVRIDANGNVGIGTASPVYPLDVAGEISTYGLHTPNAVGGITSEAGLVFDPTGEGGLVYINAGPGTGGIGAGRNVGIGTAFPTAELEVSGTVKATSFQGNGSSLTGIGSGNVGIGTVNFVPVYVGISTLSKSNMVVVSGNVGINSVNPTQRLDVVGTVKATAFSGDGSALTGIGGSISGLTTGKIIKAASSTTIADSVITEQSSNIGIGSVNPTQVLDVAGTAKMTGFQLNSSPSPGYVMVSSSVGIGTWMAASTLPISGGSATAAGGTNAVQYNSGSSTFAGSEANFSFNGSNIGIGTSNARNAKLDVTGNQYVSGNLGIGTYGNQASLAVGSTGQFRVNSSGAISALTGITTTGGYTQSGTSNNVFTGNVGIGSTNPGAVVDFYKSGANSIVRNVMAGSTTSFAEWRSNSDTVDLRFGSGGSTSSIPMGYLGTFSNHPLRLQTNNTEKARFDTTGNLGIGTSSPVNLLHVQGNAAIGYTGISANTAPTNGLIVSGNVGIGTLSPLTALHVNGTITATAITGTGSGDSYISGNLGIGSVNPNGSLIVNSGNVGIGTARPGVVLDINGGFRSIANDLGWSVVDQTDNQACTTGCTSACVIGIQNATGTAVTNLVSCSDTTADLCVCAGAN